MSFTSSFSSSLLSVRDHRIYHLNGDNFKHAKRYYPGQNTRPTSIKLGNTIQASRTYGRPTKDPSYLTLFLPDLVVETLVLMEEAFSGPQCNYGRVASI